MDDVRIALIADVHGNADALRAVLAEIDAEGISQIGNLGDHASGPLDPAGTMALLRGREMVCVRGNHDRMVGTAPREALGATDRYTAERLDAAARAWLGGLPLTAMLEGAFLCHAVPDHDETYWAESVAPDGSVELQPIEAIAARAAGVAAEILCCGHSHQPRITALPDGRLLVNPGSVGCPAYRDETPWPHAMETGAPDARWAVLERRGGRWRAELRRTAYDPARMVEAARAAGREDWAHAVATGRAPRDQEN